MKQLISLFFLYGFITSASAQTDSIVVWNKWCAKKDSFILFNAGNNQIQVYSPTLKPAQIKLKSLDNSLRIGKPEIKGDTLSVLAMPFPNKGKTMRLAVLHAKTSKQIKVITFRCDSIPHLVANFGKLKGSEAKRKDILAQGILTVAFPGSLYSYPYTIKGYTFKISTPKGGATIPVKGFFITNDVLKEINAAPDGTVFDITDIKATCPECAVRTLDNIKMKIK